MNITVERDSANTHGRPDLTIDTGPEFTNISTSMPERTLMVRTTDLMLVLQVLRTERSEHCIGKAFGDLPV